MKLLKGMIWILVFLLLAVPNVYAENTSNSLGEVSAQMVDGQPVVHIVSEQPVGYRYTVYDSIDPVRVVVDFPRMTLGDVKTPVMVGSGGIQEIRLSTFELSLGSLVRAEILLDAPVEYKVDFADNDMQLSFLTKSTVAHAATTEAATTEAAAAEAAAAEAAAAEAAAAEAAAAEAAAAEAAAAEAAAAEAAAAEAAAAEAAEVAAVEVAAVEVAAVEVAAVEVAAVEVAAVEVAAVEVAAVEVAAVEVAAVEVADVEVADVEVADVEVADVEVATSVATVVNHGNKVDISASAGMERLRYFTLDNPKRLVVDIYGVAASDSQNEYMLSEGFSKLRIGPYSDKLRFVFDATDDEFPQFTVNRDADTVQISWPASAASVAQPTPVQASSAVVSSIDFTAKDGISVYRIGMTGPLEIDAPVKEGNIVKFGVRNATISRALRRVYTSLAFPTAIQSVTPYLIDKGQTSDIRFIVQLKADVPYELLTDDGEVVFRVTDGRFAEAEPVDGEIMPVPVAGTVAAEAPVTPLAEELETKDAPQVSGASEDSPDLELVSVATSAVASQPDTAITAATDDSVSEDDSDEFSGEKISLVFDNVSVRNVLQLIAEVSELNIIASDQIKGSVTLRLIDVPWDQALDLVLDITNLGMIQDGNVVRVLPKDAIRNMREAELTAIRSQEKLEPTVTEVITVSYADLGSVSAPSAELLSDRGSITEDARNKLLIVNDVSARISKVRELIKILDTPERQVMIEARIVEVNSTYSRDLGVNWGMDFKNPGEKLGSGKLGVGGAFTVGLPSGPGNASTVPGLGAGITFGRTGIDQTVLDLRISALESSGNAKVVSTPRVTTLNGEKATISQGTTIPYETSGADGPKTEFIAAELKLEVMPVINPDNSVILEILATNDSPSVASVSAAPSIDTKKAETKVLVKDGETTVIGGIFINNKNETESGMPILKDIPWLGHLFKSSKVTDTKAELMIFITPRILSND
jgi:type IV pilus assembly protein PilQ